MRLRTCTLACALLVATFALHAQGTCIPTEADVLGPFYVSGMPTVDNLNRFGKPGELLRVMGLVRSTARGNSPIVGARIEIWQTDGDGNYYPESNGAQTDYDDTELDMRGTVITDQDGRYSFLTVIPGVEGAFGRPRHFHYRISAAGYSTLVTQHYVRGSEAVPGGVCRSAAVVRGGAVAQFPAPDIYLSTR